MKQKIIFAILIAGFILSKSDLKAQTNANLIQLPQRYFELLEDGCSMVEKKLATDPNATLATLEGGATHGHFPHAVLLPAVLYTKKHPANKHYGDNRMLSLSLRIGDLLASENEKGHYTNRGDSDWDTYMWLEAYRLLQNKLGEERKLHWQKAILENISLLEPKLVKCLDYPWYNAPFITTSPNHYSIYASTLLLGGHVFNKPEWVKMATKVLHRYCVEEQAPDGYWGEHSNMGPTTGYDYVTSTQIGLYWEYSKDPEALKALRRSLNFHENFTYPDGEPVETINDRNRYWGASMWGHFGFSNFADGRRYAAFLTQQFPLQDKGKSYGNDIESLGRIAQDAIYFHEGKTAPIPQDQTNYAYAMKIPAGIRKTGDWVVTYSGIIAPMVSLNNFFLDRQGNFSVFNKKTGLIISGANAKRQPELATFTEVVGRDSLHIPVSSKLQMNEKEDRLALAYNTFFAVLEVPTPAAKQLKFQINTVYKWGDAVSGFNLQLMLKAGETLETGGGKKIILSNEKIDLDEKELGGWLKHNGWTMHIPQGMHLSWPVYPFNPYANKPETSLDKAIGRLFTQLKPENQELEFALETL
ncbi:MAG: hypothetical protein JST09_20060 [Bacteroidetes bacterium]|nr:hypothetical protein [Bacteroidota bacterium]